MKNYLFTLAFVITTMTQLFAQMVTVGDQVPDVSVETLGTPTPQTLHLRKMVGQVVLLDFWAANCAPCIKGFPHLNLLQKTFGDQLKVVAIGMGKKAKMARYYNNQSYQFGFAWAKDGLRKAFYYNIIPHSVLVNAKGKVVAITSPINITKDVIQKVINNESITLPEKKDYYDFDPNKDYFEPDTSKGTSLTSGPAMLGIPSFTKNYSKGVFKNRRVTMYNLTVPKIYQEAYQMSSNRTILKVNKAILDHSNSQNLRCVDMFAAQPKDLYPSLQKLLKVLLPLNAQLVRRKTTVITLTQQVTGFKAKKATQHIAYTGRANQFKSQGTTLEEFSKYLEKFGVFGGFPVVNDTNLKGLYEINFSFNLGDTASFKEAMNKLGLTYQKQEREIEVLVISQ